MESAVTVNIRKKCCHLHITEKDLKKSCVASSTEAFHMCVHFHTVASIIRSLSVRDCSLR